MFLDKKLKKTAFPTKGKTRFISLYDVLHAYIIIYDVKSYNIEAVSIYGFCPYRRFSPFRHASAIHRTYRIIFQSFIQISCFPATCKSMGSCEKLQTLFKIDLRSQGKRLVASRNLWFQY